MSKDPRIGKTIGDCVLSDLIAKGSSGSVYLAHHRQLDKDVAVKILNVGSFQADREPRELKRFQREAHWACVLNHPNIVKVYQTGTDQGLYYIVMEYLAGQTLLDMISTRAPIPPQETCKIAHQVTLALREAHSKGVIHRDIKPANIFVENDGRVKLADFGLARTVADSGSVSHAGQIIGTIFYMSPEQAMGRVDIDHRVDFYSLGVTMFHALTGKLPYQGRTPLAVMEQHIAAPSPSLREVMPEIPVELDNLVKKLMAKKPQQRFASAGEVLNQIAVCQSRPAERAGRSSTPRPHRWTKWGFVALALFALSLSGALLVKKKFFSREVPEKTEMLSTKSLPEELPRQSRHTDLMAETGETIALSVPGSDGKNHPRLGWFGEEMPRGLERAEKTGEYLWEKDSSTMVYIPEGHFGMGNTSGNPDERPLRKVSLAAYYLDKYELTWEKYLAFCDSSGCARPPAPDYGISPQHPVVNVCWNDAVAYSVWAGKRLPTEAEWEKAAKGGFKIPDWSRESTITLVANIYPRRSYPWGEQLPDEGREFRCNYVASDHWQRRDKDGYVHTAPVGTYPDWASPYRCLDMAGNVWEWCYDTYHQGQTVNLENSGSNELRVIRGGSWFNFAESCRTTKRDKAAFNAQFPWIGVRLALSAPGR